MTKDRPSFGPAAIIRRAAVADAASIAALGARVFSETFRHMTAPADMQQFLANTYTPLRLATEMADPALVFFVAVFGEALAGFVQMRQGSHEPSVHGPAPVELQRLYVDGRWHGRGVAKQLVGQALCWAAQQGFETVWLGVGETNYRAQRFYEKLNLARCGQHTFYVGSDPQIDFIMQGSVQDAKAIAERW